MSHPPDADAGRQTPRPWQDPALPLGERVEALLAVMSVEEKVGQLGSFWPRPAVAAGHGDVAPMEHAFEAGRRSFEDAAAAGLGHLTRVFGSAPVDPVAGIAALRELQGTLLRRTRLGIPAIAHEECLTGFTTLGATVYPAAIAWGATFDPDLVREMASAIAADLRSVGVHQGLSPLMDVVRDYRWGRVEETIGEDPYLVATVGTAYVQGMERGGVVATLKHFAGYSASRAARNHAPVSMGTRELSDVVLYPFEMAVREGGARSVMNSYSDVDGEPAAASRWLLTEVLRERWGFDGVVVSDYWSVSFLETMHRVAASPAQAGAMALRAGLDVELPETSAYREVADLVASGQLAEEVVDRSVRRVLRQKAELGLLDAGWEVDALPPERIDLDSPRNRSIARRLAEESVVLLANDGGALPLAEGLGRLAVIGPCAAEPRTFLGCYSFPNHVLSRHHDQGTGIPVPSLLDSLRLALPGTRIGHALGSPILEADRSGFAAAVRAAEEAEIAVLAVGDLAGLFGTGTSGEGCDVVDLTLPGVQAELVEAVLATGTPVVLVVVSGRPYALGAFAGRCAAVVQAFMPGAEGGGALADILTGVVVPTGRLPIGVPDHPGGQPGTYLAPVLGRFSEGVSNLDPRPLYPFGHGLSYTSFGYDDLALSAAEIPADGTVEVSVTVRNTGGRDGAEVVQLYLSDEVAQVTRPVRELVGYARVPLAAGEAARVSFSLHADRTSFTGVDHLRVVEPGWFTVTVGRSSEDLALTGRFAVTGEPRVVDGPRVLTTPALTTPVPAVTV